MDPLTPVIAGAVVAGSAVAAGITALASGETPAILYPPAVNNAPHTGYTDDMIRRWADTGHGLFPRATKEVRFFTSTPPAGARTLNIVPRTRTPIGNGGADTGGANSLRGSFITQLRVIASEAGLNDCDVRVLAYLAAQESGWGRYCWGHNIGNVKSQGTVWSTSVDTVVRTRQVWCTNYEALGIYLLVDRVNSLDGYGSYPSHAAYYRRFRALVERHYPKYLQGARMGGLEGLMMAEGALGGDNPGGLRYSGLPSLARQTLARGYWNATQRKLGALFVR